MADKREISVALNFTSDTTQSAKAAKELAAELEKVEKKALAAAKALKERENNIRSGAYVEGLRQEARFAAMEKEARLADKYGRFGGAAVGVTQGAQGAAGAAAGYIAAAAGLVATAANMSAAVGQLNNEFLTGREKAVGFARAIPLIGSALGDLVDNVLDARDRLRDPSGASELDRSRIRDPIIAAQRSARSQADAREFGLRTEVRGARAAADAITANPGASLTAQRLAEGGSGPLGRFFGSGALAGFEADPRTEANNEALAAARRELDRAQRVAEGGAEEVAGARRRAAQANREFQDARRATNQQEFDAKFGSTPDSPAGARRAAFEGATRRNFEGIRGTIGDNAASRFLAGAAAGPAFLLPQTIGSGADTGAAAPSGTRTSLLNAANRENAALQRSLQAIADLEQKVTRNKEEQLALVKAQADVAKAQLAFKRTELAQIDEERAAVRSGARSFGGADALSQDALLGAARRFKEGGREAVTAEELGLLQSNPLTSRFVAERSERDASKDPGFQDLLQLLGVKKLEDLDAQRRAVKAEIDVKVQLDEEQFAKLAAEKLKSLNLKDLLGEIVKGQLELQLRKPELDSLRGLRERGG